ncbi:hypothetical protein GCM10022254_10490 [Actinomadura meridiana]|uniref:Uncharacterized protein n=2 Tax=Actinomadura meridiana TaxID=559626 RepID=A0ABP8BU53_9ACTN
MEDPNRPDRPDRREPEDEYSEWRDPDWHGPGSRGPYRHEQPSGREPLTARSPLRLRAILSGVALVGSAAAAVVFAVTAQREDDDGAWTAAALCAFVAVVAALDLVVIARRARH